MIGDEQRKKTPREPRRELEEPGWIAVDDGIAKTDCFILDMSAGGAKIVTDATIDVRDRVILTLASEHPKRLPCEVIWRVGNAFGIKFLPSVSSPVP